VERALNVIGLLATSIAWLNRLLVAKIVWLGYSKYIPTGQVPWEIFLLGFLVERDADLEESIFREIAANQG
jgi:hypothetical protein